MTAFGWFWADVIRKPCPVCQHPTAVGFSRNDPGARDREPTPCVLCTRAEIDNEVQFSRGTLGHPLTQQGPCVSCGTPHRLYGPQGRAQCDPCGAQASGKLPGPQREPQPCLEPLMAIPSQRQAEAEGIEAALF